MHVTTGLLGTGGQMRIYGQRRELLTSQMVRDYQGDQTFGFDEERAGNSINHFRQVGALAAAGELSQNPTPEDLL